MIFSKNPEKNSAIIWFVISIGSLILSLVFSIFLVGHFTFGRFFPVMLLPLLAFLGIVIGIALLWSSGKLDAMLSGKDLLAHWTYKSEEIAPYAAEEQKRMRNAKYLISGTCLFVLLLAAAFAYTDKSIDYTAIIEDALLFLIALVFIFVILPKMGYGKSGVNEFYLSKDGAIFAGKFHSWQEFNARLESVNLKKNPAMLEIAYSIYSQYGANRISLNIPVPRGREKEALDATKKLVGKNRG